MHENYKEFISLTLRTRNSRRPSRMLARNWKHQWLPLCLARSARIIRIVGMVINPIRLSQHLRAFWKLMNLQDCVWENLHRIIMKTILQERETIHYSITIWCTNLFLCVKPWKFPQQRQQWTRNGKNRRKFRRGTWRKSEVRKRWSMKQGPRALQFILHHQWTYVIWKCWIGGKAAKRQRSSCSPRWYCKRQFWVLCSIHWARIFSISNDSSKGHGYHLQIARLRWTSSRRSICWNPSENGGCSQIIENSKIGVSRHLDSSTTTQMAQIMVQYGRSSRSSWAKFVRSSFGRSIMRKAIWENLLRGWHKIGWKETKH